MPDELALKTSGFFTNLPVIETARLVLRPVEDDDADDIFEIASDAETAKYTSWDAHKMVEDSKTLIRFIKKRYSLNKPSNWAVILKSENKLIGLCGFVSGFAINSRAEMAFVISKAYRKKGYASEAVCETINFGFLKADLNRIEAFCDADNTASKRVLEKCGLKFEGLLRQYVRKNGELRDMKCYAVLAKDMPLNFTVKKHEDKA